MPSVPSLVCAAPGSLILEDRLVERKASDQVLVRPRRIGICGTDFHIFEGKHPYLEYPRVMGHELAIEVVEVSEDSRLAPGDICTVNPYLACGNCKACRSGKPNCCMSVSVLGVHEDGGMAGLLSVPAASLIPADGISIEECASVEFLAIGAHAVSRGAITNGESVLVVGCGPIGTGVALFACLAGGRVAVCDRDTERAAAVQRILEVENIPSNAEFSDAVSALTQGDGFDAVIDASGAKGAMESSFNWVGHGGRLVFVSVVTDSITFVDSDFHRKEMSVIGSRNATDEDFKRVMRAMRMGRVPMDQLITHRTTLEDAVHNIPAWTKAKSTLVKALIEIDD